MYTYLLLASIWIILSFLQLSSTQTTGTCCSTNLQDANGFVAIETLRPLVTSEDNFPAMRLRACTNDRVAVQIWRRLNDTTYQFRWSTEITPVEVENSLSYITISLGDTPLTLSPDDRLGVFTLTSSNVLSTPFKLDPAAGVYYSTQRYSDFDGFDATTQVVLDDIRWQRTFSDAVIFCKEPGCADQPSPSTTAVFSSTTTARPASSSGPCCPTYPVSCDPSDVTNDLKNQTGRVIELQNTINLITKMINDLFGSRQPSGTCPTGFTPGTIGVGKCYILFRDAVQMALAVLRCRDNFKARLVAIESLEEELFLKSMIGNNTIGTAVENFWTSGMYSRSTSQWLWYDESTRTSTAQVYRNWQGGVTPIPTTDNDICSTLTLNMGTNQDYWLKEACTNTNFFICEQPKTCL